MLRKSTREQHLAGRGVPVAVAAVLAAAGVAGCGDDGGNGGGTPTTPPAGTTDPSPVDPRQVDLPNATVTLPEWPDPELRDECPAGTYTFAGGTAPGGGGWEYHVTFLDGPVYADLDGQPGEEILTAVGCGPPNAEASIAALALRPTAAGQPQTMGYVQSGAGFFANVVDIRVEGETAHLRTQTGLGPDATEHERAFRWNGDGFAQVSGPTATPES